MSSNNATHIGRGARTCAGLAAVALSATLLFGGGSPASATPAFTVADLVLGVGSIESQRVLTWDTTADTATAEVAQLAKTADVVSGVFPASPASYSASAETVSKSGYTNRRVTLDSLQENTSYSYRVGAEGSWSPTYTFKTQSFDGAFDFLFLGDPQIGSSGDMALDSLGWQATLHDAIATYPNAELLVSGGDQVETSNSEPQWDAFFAPDQLRQVPYVATIGNHDVGAKNYEQHFTTPNTDHSAALYTTPATTSGGDYWFIYKDVLFMDINSNKYSTGGDAAHIQFMTDVVAAHGAEAKWKVVTFHHSIYSPADHAKDADNVVRRTDFPTVLSTLGVDLVLQGHDHSYDRTYMINNGQKANPDEQPGAAEVTAGPGGVLYVTANSASGSKYYDLTAPNASGTNGPDPLNPNNYWYASVENQEHIRSFISVNVGADALTIKDIRTGDCTAPNAAVTRGNVSTCTPGGAPGSIVDQVTVHAFHGNGEDVQVSIPDAAPGEFGWTVNGYNALVNLGTAEEHTDYFQATGQINAIAVSDTRRSLAPWAISAQVSDFQDGTKTFSGKYLGWTPAVFQAGAGAVAGPQVASGYTTGNGLSQPSVLGSATAGHSRGSAQLGAYLDLKIPVDVNKGSYRSTLTLTALS
jgi:hypothetical protein